LLVDSILTATLAGIIAATVHRTHASVWLRDAAGREIRRFAEAEGNQ
jgi:predicted nuclease of predicted toxin-antitoxin system